MKSGKQRREELSAKQSARRIKAAAQQAEETRERLERDAANGGSMNPEFVGIPRPSAEAYADYVEHPRFGKSPRFTGFDPNPNSPEVHLHWNTGYIREWERRRYEHDPGSFPWYYAGIFDRKPYLVPGTAIVADTSRQNWRTVPVTHYYDLDRRCPDCGRRFLFFAEEQKHWYEELGFPLEAQAVRCPLCRKRLQQLDRTRRRYEQLFHLSTRSVEETLEMADCCLTLVEAGIFHPRQKEHVRILLKHLPEDGKSQKPFLELIARLKRMGEAGKSESNAARASDP
ncbi:MAG TPA: zinc-ribbon domain containing protein [Chthonomonadaceae bacterium]|nr:zinc-ribbon domain containing protein [Chthonomonadaceae bacterium]